MNRFIFWSITTIFVTVLFLGVPTAYLLTHTITSTTGKTSGLIVGGVPDLVHGFQQGVHAGGGKNGSAGMTSWTGPATSWNGAQTAPARQHRAPHVAPATQHKAPKPNA